MAANFTAPARRQPPPLSYDERRARASQPGCWPTFRPDPSPRPAPLPCPGWDDCACNDHDEEDATA